MDFDTVVKLNIYETLAATAQAPTSAGVAAALGTSPRDVEAAFDRLHMKRLLVPELGEPGRIRMAPPFSGVPTAFPVQVGERRYFANCVWDALGIAAALHRDAVVEAADAHSGELIPLEVHDGRPVPQACVIHFAVPAARWWEDIVYT
ncbi:MAG: organomercurial lyase [Anaerolineales bacterium]